MIEPRIDALLAHTSTEGDPASRYALVIMSAKRARQINNYHHQLGEGLGLEDAPPPLVESRSKNYLTMAMEEISRGKLTFSYGGSSSARQARSGRSRSRGLIPAFGRADP